MLKKVQQYLLLHHPLLWNLRFVPVFLSAILINVVLYIIGYCSTNFSISNSSDYRYDTSGNGVLYFISVVVGILLFIFWLSSYSKNNAFKIFYPKTSRSLYLEWVLSFVIIFCIIFSPFSSYKGIQDKYRASISKSDMIKAVNMLNMVDILIPDYKNNYYQEYPENYPYDRMSKGRIAADNDKKDLAKDSSDTVDTVPAEEVEYSTQTFEDYPDFATLSLLNYNGYNYLYIPDEFELKNSNKNTVIKWLQDQDKEKIIELMDAFFKLQEKHGLKSNLTRDQWFDLVYSPKKYPVGDYNLISRSAPYTNTNSYYYASTQSEPKYYLEYDKLKNGYEIVLDAYRDEETTNNIVLTSLCVSLCISLCVFSFRVSNGKSWLIALVSLGVFMIINLLLSVIVGLASMGNTGFIFYLIVMLATFIGEFICIVNKINNREAKGKTNITINHVIWFLPAVLAILYAIVLNSTSNPYGSEVYNFLSDSILIFIWINAFLTFISMWFFIRFILIKWKGLPED